MPGRSRTKKSSRPNQIDPVAVKLAGDVEKNRDSTEEQTKDFRKLAFLK